MTERDFVEKYGFSLEDLETACIDDMLENRYICYDVKELAYKIASEIYNKLNVNVDYYIMYKLITRQGQYTHKIAFYLEDIVFIFDIKWRGSALCVEDWCVVSQEEFETYKDWEDIEIAINDEEEDYE